MKSAYRYLGHIHTLKIAIIVGVYYMHYYVKSDGFSLFHADTKLLLHEISQRI